MSKLTFVLNKSIDGNGFVTYDDVPIAQEGVYEYLGVEIEPNNPMIASQLFKVYIPGAELENSAVDFAGMPFINDHTMLGGKGTAPEKKGIDGVIGDNVYFENGVLYASKLRVYTDRLKAAIDNGKKQLSTAYYALFEKTPGVFNGQRYDYVQRIFGANHLALVEKGRMGDAIAVSNRSISLEFTINNEVKKMDKDEIIALIRSILAEDVTNAVRNAMTAIKNEEAEADKEKAAENESADEDTDDKEKSVENKGVDIDKLVSLKVSTAVANATADIATKAFEKTQASLIEKADALALVEPLVGIFNHAAMSADDVLKYAADKLQLDGDPATAIKTLVKVKAQSVQNTVPARTETQLKNGQFV